jgi:hypothetical protein
MRQQRQGFPLHTPQQRKFQQIPQTQMSSIPPMMTAQQLQQQRYKTNQESVAAYTQRYKLSQNEILRRRAALQAQNMDNAQASLRSRSTSGNHGNAMTMEAPKYKHKLYVKSKDTNCEYAYDYFAKKYNKDVNTGGVVSDGYTKISKRDNLELQIEVINILRQPELRPAWLKAVPCLLFYNKSDDSWTPHYGSKCMAMMHNIAINTPPDIAKDDNLGSYNKGSGFSINNTFEYADDPRYENMGKVSSEEMMHMEKLRSSQDQRYQSQQHANVNLTIKDEARPKMTYQEYLAQRGKVHVLPKNQTLFTRPETLY